MPGSAPRSSRRCRTRKRVACCSGGRRGLPAAERALRAATREHHPCHVRDINARVSDDHGDEYDEDDGASSSKGSWRILIVSGIVAALILISAAVVIGFEW